MIEDRKKKYRIAVNVTIDFNSYIDISAARGLDRGYSLEGLTDILMKEAINAVINPDYNRRGHVRVTDVTLESYRTLPLSMPGTFADICKQMGKDYDT